MQKTLKKMIGWFLPNERSHVSAHELELKRVLVVYSIVLFFVSFFYTGFYSYMHMGYGVVLTISTKVLVIITIALVRIPGDISIKVFWFTMLETLLGALWITGGAHSPIALWSVVIPFVTSMLMGQRAAYQTAA